MKPVTKKKFQTERQRISYTAKLYVSYILAAIILVITTNLIVKTKGFPQSGWFAADESTWITFYGTLIGGFITLLGVNQTIRFTQDEDRRLKVIEDEKNEKEADLLLIRHLWELETNYHQLSKNLHIMIVKLEKLHEPTMHELENIIVFFQDQIAKHDFLMLSARIDWETYNKVNTRMRKLRKLIIQAETDLLENQHIEERTLIKMQLTQKLREEKVEVDKVDAHFEEKRARLEEKHLEN